jgi:hypothetical protein
MHSIFVLLLFVLLIFNFRFKFIEPSFYLNYKICTGRFYFITIQIGCRNLTKLLLLYEESSNKLYAKPLFLT